MGKQELKKAMLKITKDALEAWKITNPRAKEGDTKQYREAFIAGLGAGLCMKGEQKETIAEIVAQIMVELCSPAEKLDDLKAFMEKTQNDAIEKNFFEDIESTHKSPFHLL